MNDIPLETVSRANTIFYAPELFQRKRDGNWQIVRINNKMHYIKATKNS